MQLTLWKLCKELYQGKSIWRTLMNFSASHYVQPKGIGIDIGGKGNPSYWRFINSINDDPARHNFFVMDIIQGPSVQVVGSATSLPFKPQSCDTVLCFNLFEHILDFQKALHEARLILKDGGILYGSVPFLKCIHSDPSDHWRYTETTLRHLLTNSRFTYVDIHACGGLFCVLYDLLYPLWRVALVRVPIGLLCWTLNSLYSKIVGNEINTKRYPLGYFFIAK